MSNKSRDNTAYRKRNPERVAKWRYNQARNYIARYEAKNGVPGKPERTVRFLISKPVSEDVLRTLSESRTASGRNTSYMSVTPEEAALLMNKYDCTASELLDGTLYAVEVLPISEASVLLTTACEEVAMHD